MNASPETGTTKINIKQIYMFTYVTYNINIHYLHVQKFKNSMFCSFMIQHV